MRHYKPKGYWADFDNLKKELQPIIKEIRHFPTPRELEKRRGGSLVNSICEYYGGFYKVREKMGYESKKKSFGYWKNFENVKREIEPIIKEIGHFPNSTELEKIDRTNLLAGIEKYQGGINKVRVKMGYKLKTKPPNYWKNFDNIKKELLPIVKELRYFPTGDELIKMGKQGLLRGIERNSSITEVRRIFGFRELKKPKNYGWSNLERELGELIDQEFKDKECIIKKKGEFPTYTQLTKIGRNDIAHQISKQGGFPTVRKKMGFDLIKKPNDYWKNFDNIKKELGSIIKEFGHFPNEHELKKVNKLSLSTAISTYHGGFFKVREKLGYPQLKKPNGYWKDEKKIKNRLEQIIKEIGHFPNSTELAKIDCSLATGIGDYHGGFFKVREKMGYKQPRKSCYYWKNFNNVKKELEPIIKEIGHFPTCKELIKFGKTGLLSAMNKIHGINNTKKRLGYNLKIKEDGYWKKFENVIRELEPMIKNFGRFPTQTEITIMKKSSLIAGINKYHGGLNKVRELMGYEVLVKSPNYWQNFENVKKELEPIIKEIRHFPNSTELRERKLGYLWSIMNKYHGGVTKIRQLLGYPSNGKIRTEKSLVDLLNNDEKARRVVERFGGDIGDVADILAVIYEGRLSQEDAAKLVAKPSVRAYLGRFRRPIGGIGELAEISNELLPHDKNEVIQGILYRKVTEYIYQKCGPYPSREKREGLLKEFEGELSKVGGNGKC